MSDTLVKVIAGSTIRLQCEFRNWPDTSGATGTLSDPSDLRIDIYSPRKEILLDREALDISNRVSQGIFFYDFKTTREMLRYVDNKRCIVVYEFVGMLDGTPIIGQGRFEIVDVLE